ncbi:hypothetical protein J2X63_003169 [Agromyces sp. 3263]|nr:hypothetical protein [Agromyces sp. 3263]
MTPPPPTTRYPEAIAPTPGVTPDHPRSSKYSPPA